LKLAVRLLLLIAAVYVGMNVLMYVNQRDYMYLPSVDRIAPSEAGLNGVKEVVLQSAANAELISWYAAAAEGRPTVLLFHGNAGAVYHRAYRIRELQAAGYGIFILGYPGYGGSGGEPTEASMLEAAQLAYEHLLDAGLSADDIIIWGESIGTGVAVQLAATVEAKALILEAPMSSASDVAAVHYPYKIARFLMKDKFASADYIDKVGMPLLVIHGDSDRVIPLELGRKLAESAVEPKTLVVVEGAGHNNLYQFQTNRVATEFIESL
jgi:fermentation-respiration switch protein FrsA (DUF1100 family)